jgi:Mg2+ and Co2+ transporter CorA
VTSRLQQRRFRNPNDAFAELLEAIVGHIASNLRSVEQELNTLSVEIFAEQRAHRKHKKRLGLKRVVQRLGKRNSMIANLRESSLSLASLVSYFIGHVGRFAEFRPKFISQWNVGPHLLSHSPKALATNNFPIR